MRFDHVLPALRAGRRVRRAVWKGDRYLLVNNYRPEEPTVDSHHFGGHGSWPWSPEDRHDVLAEDWEIVPEPDREAAVPLRHALDALTADLRAAHDGPELAWRDHVRLASEALFQAMVNSSLRDDKKPVFEKVREATAHCVRAVAFMLQD